jgi:hypothetical protein
VRYVTNSQAHQDNFEQNLFTESRARNREVRMEENGYLWPESEMELVEKSRENWPESYKLYQKMHNAKSWRAEEVIECFEQISQKQD